MAESSESIAPSTGALAQKGQPAPDFELAKVDGRKTMLSLYRGRVLVLEFGSLSCPEFRDRIPAFEKLLLHYGARAEFLIIYTKEAHPAGEHELERNREDGIIVEQPKDQRERVRLALKMRNMLHLTAPIAVDTMDDAVSTAYGGFPNACFVIGRDGMIVARQQWADPSGLGRHIEEAASKPAPRPNRELQT